MDAQTNNPTPDAPRDERLLDDQDLDSVAGGVTDDDGSDEVIFGGGDFGGGGAGGTW